nr:hypothetical protein [Tanacetum cinerariifolium]
VDVVQQAFLDDVDELARGVELGRGGRLAADDAVEGDGARLVAAGDGGVDPGAAKAAVGLGHLLDRGRFAARGPPVDHLGARSGL